MKSKRISRREEERLIQFENEDRILRARTRFMSFVTYVKPSYDPQWYHRYCADKLDAFARGEIKRLMLFMPPRHGKSDLSSRLLPPFMIGQRQMLGLPQTNVILASYSGALSGEMNVDAQRIMESAAYKELFPDSLINDETGTKYGRFARSTNKLEVVHPTVEKDGRIKYVKHATFRSVGVGGAVTGFGANIIIIDDIHKNQEEADSLAYRDRAFKFYQSTLATRLEKGGQVLLLMTRWHEDDLAGRLLKLAEEDPESDQWETIRFPAIAESIDDPMRDANDHRKEGEALWPELYPAEDMRKRMKSVGSRVAACLYQQRPTPQGGGVIKRKWWRYYENVPDDPGIVVQFWDCAQKPGISNDYSVCATWKWIPTRGYYLLDMWREKVEAPDLEITSTTMYFKHTPSAVVIEDKSAGSSLIQYLCRPSGNRVMIPVVPYDPGRRDKTVRALAAVPTIENGLCYLPKLAPWLEDFVGEHERFPNGANDDIVDTTSMMYEYFTTNGLEQPRVRSL